MVELSLYICLLLNERVHGFNNIFDRLVKLGF